MKIEKGITLIALIITIVVLLILATVTLTNLGQYNIIENTNTAVKKYEEVTGKDEGLLGEYNAGLDDYVK